MKNKNKNKSFDLENDPVKSLFIRLWVPTMISVLIGGTFIVFDTIFVSHGFHPGSIANDGIWYWSNSNYASNGAAGLSYVMPYTLMMIAIAAMIGGGLSYKITELKVGKDSKNQKRAMNSHLPIAIIYGTFIMIFILIFGKVLIWAGSGFQQSYIENWYNNPLMNDNWEQEFANSGYAVDSNAATGHLFSQAAWYLRIQGLAAIPYVYMYSSTMILRTEGKTIVATKVNLFALSINIVLDIILINVFGMNLIGAAIGTVIAQTFGMIFYIFYFRYKFPNKTTDVDWDYAKNNILPVSKKGTSNLGLQLNSAMTSLVFTISIGLINYGNTEVINGYTSSFQSFIGIYMLVSLIINGIVISTSPIITFNSKIGQEERANEAKKIGLLMVIFVGSLFTLTILIFPIIVTTLFNSMPETPGYTQRIAQILVIGFVFNTMILFSGIYFQSKGEDKKSSIILYLKPILLFVLVLSFGFAMSETNTFGAWQNSILPWNDDAVGLGSNVSLGLFWGLPATDIIVGSLAILLLWKDNKKNNNDVSSKNEEKETSLIALKQ